MKNNNIKKQSNLFVMLSSLLCVFMIASVFTSNFRFKPTYSADDDDCDTDECLTIKCPYGPTPCTGTKCYKCMKDGSPLYIYDKSAADAKKDLKADGECTSDGIDNSNCNDPCVEVCWMCNDNGTPRYAFAYGVPNARQKLGGLPESTHCEQTSNDNCNSPTTPAVKNCYRCNVNGSSAHVMTTTASSAAKYTGGTDCKIVADSYCATQRKCYRCTVNGSPKYGYATSDSEAASSLGGTNCGAVADSYCQTNPSVNPPTGTTAIVIAWIVGVVAIGYSVWYFIKLNAMK